MTATPELTDDFLTDLLTVYEDIDTLPEALFEWVANNAHRLRCEVRRRAEVRAEIVAGLQRIRGNLNEAHPTACFAIDQAERTLGAAKRL